VIAALGIILGAIYLLHMTARVIFGPLKVPGGHGGGHHDHGDSADDIGAREIAILVPIALVCVLLGVLPNLVLDTLKLPVDQIRQPVATASHPPLLVVARATRP
jgi:NADH-quinone oxidoreductase subunit M